MSLESGTNQAIGLRDLVAASKSTECPFCGSPRKAHRTKRHLTCGDPACKAAYQRLWKRDLRRLVTEVGQAAGRLSRLTTARTGRVGGSP